MKILGGKIMVMYKNMSKCQKSIENSTSLYQAYIPIVITEAWTWKWTPMQEASGGLKHHKIISSQ